MGRRAWRGWAALGAGGWSGWLGWRAGSGGGPDAANLPIRTTESLTEKNAGAERRQPYTSPVKIPVGSRLTAIYDGNFASAPGWCGVG